MEKYILGENIIITTKERYEKKFKALGYEPYKEMKENEIDENNEEINSTKKRKMKDN